MDQHQQEFLCLDKVGQISDRAERQKYKLECAKIYKHYASKIKNLEQKRQQKLEQLLEQFLESSSEKESNNGDYDNDNNENEYNDNDNDNDVITSCQIDNEMENEELIINGVLNPSIEFETETESSDSQDLTKNGNECEVIKCKEEESNNDSNINEKNECDSEMDKPILTIKIEPNSDFENDFDKNDSDNSDNIDKIWKCEICKKILANKKSLKNHILNKHPKPEKRNKCNFDGCGKMFSNKWTLKSHQVCHTNEKPFTCNQCHRQFKRKCNYKRHINTKHSNDKPFQCLLCNTTFKFKSNMKRHMQDNVCL